MYAEEGQGRVGHGVDRVADETTGGRDQIAVFAHRCHLRTLPRRHRSRRYPLPGRACRQPRPPLYPACRLDSRPAPSRPTRGRITSWNRLVSPDRRGRCRARGHSKKEPTLLRFQAGDIDAMIPGRPPYVGWFCRRHWLQAPMPPNRTDGKATGDGVVRLSQPVAWTFGLLRSRRRQKVRISWMNLKKLIYKCMKNCAQITGTKGLTGSPETPGNLAC